jgi:hypothetical protein
MPLDELTGAVPVAERDEVMINFGVALRPRAALPAFPLLRRITAVEFKPVFQQVFLVTRLGFRLCRVAGMFAAITDRLDAPVVHAGEMPAAWLAVRKDL